MEQRGIRKATAGKVVLIGAGPGNPELMTLKAARALGAADVVRHARVAAASPGMRAAGAQR